MKKYLLLTATAALALASCSSDDFVGTDQDRPQAESTAIAFGPQTGKAQRADHVGADAATRLNNNFVVEGIRVNKSDDAQVEVFDHYNVNYTAGTANTTESNSSNWEYVNQTKHALSAATLQAIKFWNYDSKQYDFVAFSYGTSSLDKSTALSAIDYTKLGAAVTSGTPVYTVAGSADELAKAYIADLVTLYNRDGVSEFGKDAVVTPKFRNLGTKVRLAFYETVPGYSVKNVKFYSAAWDGTTPTSTAGAEAATLFAANAIFPSATSTGTMSVYFPTVGFAKRPGGASEDADYNQAHIKFAAGTGSGEELVTTKTFGALDYKATEESGEDNTVKYLGRTSATATYAGSSTGNYYSTVLPLGTKDNIQIRIEYDLIPVDGSDDVIHVRDARAVVPAAYADWKPNYAYTYIFKISDNTNGWTGTQTVPNPSFDPNEPEDPITNPATIEEVVEGLTPITFDAVVVDTEDGIQETITTVATPSITTYQEGKVVTAGSEYQAGDVYVSVMNGTTPVTLTDSPANYGVYLVTAGESIINEAIAIDMLAGNKSNTGITWTPATYEAVSEVPAADGNTLTVSAAKFAAASGKTYVFNVIVGGKNYVKIIRVQ